MTDIQLNKFIVITICLSVIISNGAALRICFGPQLEFNIEEEERETTAVLWPCQTSSDCAAVSTASCSIYGFCQCPVGFTFSTDVTRCVANSAFDGRCDDPIQCSHMLTGARCVANFCECDPGYHYLRGRCRQLKSLSEPCNDDIECFSYIREGVVCTDGRCQCAEAFYERANNVCRRKLMRGEKCVVKTDCVEDGVDCINFVCQDVSVRSIGVQTQDLRSIQKKSLVRQEENIEPEYYEKPSFDEGDARYGDDCSGEGSECPGLKYSVCRQGRCHCKDGFFQNANICKAEIGEYVEDASYCGGSGIFKPNTGRCGCDVDQFDGVNMRGCLKSVLGVGTSCTAASQCSPYGEAICTTVSPKRCECRPYSQYNAETELCELKKGVEEYCDASTPCSLENSVCTLTRNTCECKDEFIPVNNECKPGKGSPCDTTEECGFENSECVQVTSTAHTTCECQKGFVYENNTCNTAADEYEGECASTAQCEPLLGELGKCIEGKCICESHLQYNDGKCYQKIPINKECTRAGECFVPENIDRVECRNGICQCQYNYKVDAEKQVCVRSGKNSSNRLSAFKVITLIMTTTAVLIIGSALREAYYP